MSPRTKSRAAGQGEHRNNPGTCTGGKLRFPTRLSARLAYGLSARRRFPESFVPWYPLRRSRGEPLSRVNLPGASSRCLKARSSGDRRAGSRSVVDAGLRAWAETANRSPCHRHPAPVCRRSHGRRPEDRRRWRGPRPGRRPRQRAGQRSTGGLQEGRPAPERLQDEERWPPALGHRVTISWILVLLLVLPSGLAASRATGLPEVDTQVTDPRLNPTQISVAIRLAAANS